MCISLCALVFFMSLYLMKYKRTTDVTEAEIKPTNMLKVKNKSNPGTKKRCIKFDVDPSLLQNNRVKGQGQRSLYQNFNI